MKHARFLGLNTLLATCFLSAAAPAHLVEQTKVVASDAVPGDQFGAAVDIDGVTAVVGSPFHQVGGIQGAVYVYDRLAINNWPQVAKLTPAGAGPLDRFGAQLSIDGTYLGVSAPRADADEGAVYIFNGAGASWSQTQVLKASDARPGDHFGNAIDLDGDTLAIGAPGNEAVYVFRLIGGTWVEEQILKLTNRMTGDLFGTSVDVYQDELVVGAPFEDTDATDAGSVYLFERTGSVWTAMLRFGSATPGIGDGFGHGACIGANFIGVGAPFDDDQGADSGSAHYFRRNGPGSWISEGTLTSVSAPVSPGDHVGETILVDTNLFLIGQPDGDLQGIGSGGTQTFIERTGTFFGDVMFPTDTTDGDALGSSIGMDGCWLIAGAPHDDDMGDSSGSAYIFLGTPLTTLYCIPGISAEGCAATLSSTGNPSASENTGFHVIADGVAAGIAGLFFYGTNGPQQAPWGNGTSFQCVVPPVIRMGLITSTGSGTCAGQFSQDLNTVWCSTCPKPLKNPGAGAEIYLQLWYRDPANTSNQSTALSNAAQIAICP